MWLTVQQVAAVYEVQPTTVRDWIRRGHLRRHGGLLRADEVEAWMKKRQVSKIRRGQHARPRITSL